MATEDNYLEINRNSWNSRAVAHLDSDFYDVPRFLKGNTSLKDIELELLGDVKGKSVLHLQCHFGQDSISIARMGARVTGVDFSNIAIEYARKLSRETNTEQDAEFICCDIYDLPQHLNKKYDTVFTSYGTIGWLPDLDKWSGLIFQYLKPGGEFVIVEFHPVLWMFDENFTGIIHRYFNSEAIIETETSTYTAKNEELITQNVTWNHSLGEVINNLIKSGLRIASFEEYDYSPYDCFNQTEESAPGKFRIRSMKNMIPMVFSVKAVKE